MVKKLNKDSQVINENPGAIVPIGGPTAPRVNIKISDPSKGADFTCEGIPAITKNGLDSIITCPKITNMAGTGDISFNNSSACPPPTPSPNVTPTCPTPPAQPASIPTVVVAPMCDSIQRFSTQLQYWAIGIASSSTAAAAVIFRIHSDLQIGTKPQSAAKAAVWNNKVSVSTAGAALIGGFGLVAGAVLEIQSFMVGSIGNACTYSVSIAESFNKPSQPVGSTDQKPTPVDTAAKLVSEVEPVELRSGHDAPTSPTGQGSVTGNVPDTTASSVAAENLVRAVTGDDSGPIASDTDSKGSSAGESHEGSTIDASDSNAEPAGDLAPVDGDQL